jgi:hypothetical protein
MSGPGRVMTGAGGQHLVGGQRVDMAAHPSCPSIAGPLTRRQCIPVGDHSGPAGGEIVAEQQFCGLVATRDGGRCVGHFFPAEDGLKGSSRADSVPPSSGLRRFGGGRARGVQPGRRGQERHCCPTKPLLPVNCADSDSEQEQHGPMHGHFGASGRGLDHIGQMSQDGIKRRRTLPSVPLPDGMMLPAA